MVEKKLRGTKLVGTITGPDKASIASAHETLMAKLNGKMPMTFKAGKGKNAVTLRIHTA